MSIVVYADTESGGLLPTHPTIQLSAVALDGDLELGAFDQKIAFAESDADPAALALNHYSREAWVNACAPGIAASRFAAWLRPYCTQERVSSGGNPYRVAILAAYNAGFDKPRIEALFGTQFCPWDRRVRDVLQRVLFYFDEHDCARPRDYKLGTVAAHFGLDVDGAHDALADARLAARAYRAILREEQWF